MSFVDYAETHAQQREKFFMVLAFVGHKLDLDSGRNQILSSAIVPSYETVCKQLLIFGPYSFCSNPTSLNVSVDSNALVSNSYQRCGREGEHGHN